MPVPWTHEVDARWLAARRKYLTASEVVKLLPQYRKTKGQGIVPLAFLQLAASKLSRVPDNTQSPSQAAARGHFMESYALKEFNRQAPADLLYHWDDTIIANGCIGYSPDALDLVSVHVPCLMADDMNVKPTKIGEIKSYQPDQHVKRFYTEKLKLDERWQIAMAMAVSKTIDFGYLIFYCPPLDNFFYRTFNSKELKDEINVCIEMSGLFDQAMQIVKADMAGKHESNSFNKMRDTEEGIYREFVMQEALKGGSLV